MHSRTKIEWTEATWNPVTGCTRASAGCDNCYAVRLTYRLESCGQSKYTGLTSRNRQGRRHFNGVVKCHEADLQRPLRWTKPLVIFVNSMSDLFHPAVPADFIRQVFEVMEACPQHTFQVLTKRPARAAELNPTLPWLDNVWLGTSVEDGRVTDRVNHLRQTRAAVKFLSVEPLIGPIPALPVAGIDWVITGGESGAGSRPLNPDWARRIRDRCIRYGVPHFFKQWGKLSNNPDPADPTAKENGGTAKGGRMLDGRTWDELPSTGKMLLV
ncbi:MAG: phage Gp37/Gp68 family protein [Pirellulales bacterium]